VLVDRYLRLCLTDPGGDPRAILAITFTRKATVEILSRLQSQARRLARLDDPELAAALGELLGRTPSAAEVDRARWLHEALLEDPAGLGITTLHGFCQRVLARFAAEAGLDPRFEVLDERRATDYQAEALDALEAELAARPDLAAAYAALADTVAGARQKVAGLLSRRMHLQRWCDRVAPPPGPVAADLARPLAPLVPDLLRDLRAALVAGTPWAAADPSAPDPAVLDPAVLAPALAASLADLAEAGLDAVLAADAPEAGPTAASRATIEGWRAELRAAADALAPDLADVARVAGQVRAVLLTGAGALRQAPGRRKTKTARQAAFAAAAAPVLELLGWLELPGLLAGNATLLACALRAIDLLALAKRRDRVVDFEDLEYLALRLLTDPELGPHLHYRLDARLDHVLLDEFQDTNRNQWDLLLPLLRELLGGGERRTVLVVGDVKQSIYGFRGAEPAVFGAARALLARQVGPAAEETLPTNFRSLPAVVEVVGELCQQPPLVDLLGAEEAVTARQQVARRDAAVGQGQVTFVEPFDPLVDRTGHDRAAAATVALIRSLTDGRTHTSSWDPERGREVPRPLRHGDVLVLARTKTHLAAYEDALRRAGIPYVPAGRGLLARSREVQDVLALLRWLCYPADDTAGATVLRSPLWRRPEAEVQALLAARRAGRRRSLREVLAAAAGPELAAVSARLARWFSAAGLMPLHDLLRRIYREGDVLARMETAGGEQARFNLLRLLDLALAAEADVRMFAHITGWGLAENLARVIPSGLVAELERNTWTPAPIFAMIAQRGRVEQAEMERTFNMGVGMVAVVAPEDTDRAQAVLTARHVDNWVLGTIKRNPEAKGGSGRVNLVGDHPRF